VFSLALKVDTQDFCIFCFQAVAIVVLQWSKYQVLQQKWCTGT